MIKLKSREEIKIMAAAGDKLKSVVNQLKLLLKPGISTNQIEKTACQLIDKVGGYPSFKTVKGYHWATCLPVNAQVVHTPPSKYRLRDGDILTFDIGLMYKGYHSDYAETVVIGSQSNSHIDQFLVTGRQALEKAVNRLKPGRYLGELSQVIESTITNSNYKVIKQLTGHGIGQSLHEDPLIPGFLDRPIEKTPIIKPGMTLAVEVIYSLTSDQVVYEDNQHWSMITSDGSLSACFEKTVAVLADLIWILN